MNWKGLAVVIVGGGESLNLREVRDIGIARARNLIRVVALNDAVYPCWFADLLWACDAKWWRYHGALERFAGRKIRLAVPNDKGDDTNHVDHPGLESIEKSPIAEGFDPDPRFVVGGGNSGHQALHFVAHQNPRLILLVAYNMKGRHWFGGHPPGVASSTPDYPNRIAQFNPLREAITARGIRVVNCTRGSALPGFPMSSLENELARLGDKHGR